MATAIMPLAAGLFEEGVGSHSPSVSQKTCVANWADLQKTKGGPIESNNSVDKFLAKGYTGRCRIFFGVHSPQFALAAGSVTLHEPTDNKTGTCPRWWEPDVQALQKDFLTKFAAKYDGKLSAIFLANGGTIYAEPFIRGIADGTSRAALLKAGYTAELDKASYVAGYNMCRAFKSTRIAQAFNPWQYVTPDGKGHSDVDFTMEMMDKLCATFPRRAIIQNNSIRTPMLGGLYPPMYTHMKSLHDTTKRAISYQCATQARIGSNQKTIEWAIGQGGHAVELSPGFTSFMSEAEMAKYNTALRANA